MFDVQVSSILNGLLAATRNSPLVHLSDSAAFVSSADVDMVDAIQAMALEEMEHAAALADLLTELGGAPRPAPPDAHTAELHYLELHFLLPRLLKSKEALWVAYASARSRLAGAPKALEVVSRLEAGQRRQVEILRKLSAGSPVTAP